MSFLAAYRRLLLAGAVGVALLLAGVIFAAHDARHRILQALGPRTTVSSISLNYPTVTLHDVHVAADAAWPSAREFDAEEVAVDITAASLWAYRRGEPLAIADVRVVNGTLSMLRTAGHLTILPALRDTSRAKAAEMRASDAASPDAPETALVLSHMHFDGMHVDLYDATVPGDKPQHLRFDDVAGQVDGLALPRLAQPIALDLRGKLKGAERNGTVWIQGSITPAAHDAKLAVMLNGVDMLALQPYLFKLADRSVRHGTLNLAIDSNVVDRAVHATGRLAIDDLQFAEDGGAVVGLSRRAVLAALKRDGRIALKFSIDGRTDDPKFSLDEHIALRVAGGLGEAVGSGVHSVVDGLKGLLERPQSPGR